MSKVAVCNMQGEALGEYAFPEDMLVLDRGAQAVQDAVVAYRANQRAGTASTLGKAVSYTHLTLPTNIIRCSSGWSAEQ